MGYIWKPRTAIIKPRKNDSVLDKIMKIRGYDEDEIDNFLMPDITNELPWQGLKNIEKAVEVFQTTIFNGCNIVIAGDPDADGITSLAVMHNVNLLNIMVLNLMYHTPIHNVKMGMVSQHKSNKMLQMKLEKN